MDATVFSPFQLNRLTLPNRVVRSATHEGMATTEGLVTSALVDQLVALTKGEVGLLLSGHALVSAEGRAGRWQLAIDHDHCIPGLQLLTAAVHHAGGRIFLQLAHAGGMAPNRETAVGPSPFSPDNRQAPCRELTEAELIQLTIAFARAAKRARQAGFDGVQIHAAHGYLLSQFLSGFYNKRADRYGGTTANRARLLYEILALIRGEAGDDFPITVKLNSEDFVPDGFSAAECLAVCGELAARGINAIEISGGIPAAIPARSPVRCANPGEADPVYYEQAARNLKAAVPVPIALVGGIRYLSTAERLLQSGACDLIALSRPLIREPELVKRWHAGDTRRAGCISCNACFRTMLTGKGLYCPVAAKEEAKG